MFQKIINSKKDVKQVRVPTHFVFVLDNSGSMYGVINTMKNDLKNKLSTLVEENDNVSILTFSSRNDVKVVIKDWKVKNISKDVDNFNKAIDNFVYARGCTCFNEPLNSAIDIIQSVDNGNAVSVLFLTDGYHNDGGSKQDVILAVESLSKFANNFTVVEYGDYCDHKFLMEIVEKAGSNTISSHMYQDDMRYFEPVMYSFLKNEVMSAKKVEHNITNSYYPFVFSGDKRFNIVDGKVFVPEDLESFTVCTMNMNDSSFDEDSKYSLLYHLASLRMVDEMYNLLNLIGDVYLGELVTNSFGVEFTRATEYIKQSITDTSKRYVKGLNHTVVPDENAYCVLDLLSDIKDAQLVLNADEFEYKRVSRKMVQKSSIVTDEEKAGIKKSSDLEELMKTKYELKFDSYDKNQTYPLYNLVWNTSRANISFQTHTKGSVDVSNVPGNIYGLQSVPTFIYRNYTIIQDGRKNITKIPVKISDTSKLIKNNVSFVDTGKGYIVIDISNMPVINRGMVKGLSGNIFTDLYKEYESIKAKLKVAKYIKDENSTQEGSIYEGMYTDEQITWLESIGIGKNGFAPKLVGDETTDSYVSQVVELKVKGLSSLPKVSDAISNPSTFSKKIVADAYNEINNDISSGKDIVDIVNDLSASKSNCERNISKAVFALIMSQRWFDDIAEGELVNKDGFEMTITISEKEISI